ncbi:MAG TPA: DNA polymerase III subunit beta [Candidatus Limnocylindrales bacterium]|nr:DNA polymerase III subunit beta [Candidatus Limnocylindrales bacterium]
MKLTAMQENLARGLSTVSRAVSSRATLPVLSNVLLRTEDGGLKLTATNLEIAISAWVPGKIDGDGSLTVPARLFADVVSGLPAGERVELSADGPALKVSAGRYQTHLRGIDADEFPVIPPPGERPTTRISQRELREALSEVVFAAASDEARPILTGVLTRLSGDRLTIAAADNYRIAVRSLPILDAVEETSLVVPARSYFELMRVLVDSDEPIEMMLAGSKNQVIFHVEGVDLVSRLIDGQFPNYQQVLPTSHSTRAVVDREELLKAVRLSALIASSAANVVKLSLGDAGSGTITIAAAAEVGDTKGEVEAAIEGEPVQIAFNARYLQDALGNVDAEQVALEFTGPLSPGVMRRTGADDDYVHVIMPVRTPS